MRKDEVETYRVNNGYGAALPTVNVKMRGDHWDLRKHLPLGLGGIGLPGGGIEQVYTDPGFTEDWIEQHEREANDAFELACEDGYEQATELAQETFGMHVKVWSEGRSGGWLVVEGLSDVEDWTADEVAQWTAFAEQVRAIADDTTYRMLWNLYANVYEPEREEAELDRQIEQDRRDELDEPRAIALRAAAQR